MKKQFVSLEEVALIAQDGIKKTFQPMEHEETLLKATLDNAQEVLVCSPLCHFYINGFYDCDLPTKHYVLLNQVNHGLMVFRLEGHKLMIINWSEIKHLFTIDSLSSENSHWTIEITDTTIQVVGNPQQVKAQSFNYAVSS